MLPIYDIPMIYYPLTDVNRAYLEEGKLRVKSMGRGFAFRQGWVTSDELEGLGKAIAKSDYGKYFVADCRLLPNKRLFAAWIASNEHYSGFCFAEVQPIA